MWRSRALPLAAVLFLLAGCSLMGGGGDDTRAADARVEKSKIYVAALPTAQAAPLQRPS